MHYGKPPLSYADQLGLLTGRGLSCPDPQRAAEWLARIGYYRLSAYFIPFKQPGSDQFLSGTTFAEIVDLYKFDGGLRLLTLQAIDRIEIGVRAAMTYHLAHDLGTFGYADPANYTPRYNHAQLMSGLQNEERKARFLSSTTAANTRPSSAMPAPITAVSGIASWRSNRLFHRHGPRAACPITGSMSSPCSSRRCCKRYRRIRNGRRG